MTHAKAAPIPKDLEYHWVTCPACDTFFCLNPPKQKKQHFFLEFSPKEKAAFRKLGKGK